MATTYQQLILDSGKYRRPACSPKQQKLLTLLGLAAVTSNFGGGDFYSTPALLATLFTNTNTVLQECPEDQQRAALIQTLFVAASLQNNSILTNLNTVKSIWAKSDADLDRAILFLISRWANQG